MSPDMHFPCLLCREKRFLFFGVCRDCDPILFRAYDDAKKRLNERFDLYKKETGREPLDDWEAFERWLDA